MFSACMKISLDGLWILVLLVYSHIVYTSVSILHCPQVGDSNGHKKAVSTLHLKCLTIMHACVLKVWFVDGTVECFTGSHAGLATFAIIVLVLSITLMIFTLLVSLRKIKVYLKMIA